MSGHLLSQGKNLDTAEHQRLDSLLSQARMANYLTYLFSGIALSLTFSTNNEVALPYGNIIIPLEEAVLATYYLVIILNLGAYRMYLMALPWLELDKRRPPFSWIALSDSHPNNRSPLFWIMLPIAIAAVSLKTVTNRHPNEMSLPSLIVIGFFVIISATPSNYWYFVKHRLDERGGSATFSIYLLYWTRIFRNLLGILFISLPVVAFMPQWDTVEIKQAYESVLVIYGFIFVIRLVGGSKPIYNLIDKFGTYFHFPGKSKHY